MRNEKSGFLLISVDLDLDFNSIWGTGGLSALDWIASPFLLSILEPLDNEGCIAIIDIDFAKRCYFIDHVLVLSVSTECM